jgi:quinol monooxygenase YgiN
MTEPEVRFVVQIEERFKAAAQRCAELSRAEPGTLLYDWFLDEASGQARLVEAYATVADVIAHARGPVFTDAGPEMMASCRFVHMDAFGDTDQLAGGPQFWPSTYWGRRFAGLTG